MVNSLPKKRFQWSELQNVVLKDEILTLDFHNNKLIQKEIETPVSAEEEKEFNDFCFNCIQAESLTLKA